MRIPKLSSINKETFIIIYKLLYDALFLLLVSFAAMLVAEGALPGLISAHIGLAKLAIAIIIVLGTIIWIGSNHHLVYEKPSLKKNKLSPVLILFAFLLIGNSLLKFSLWENMMITLTILFIFFLIYQLFFGSEK